MRKLLFVTLALMGSAAFAQATQPTQTIAELVQADPQFSTLATALKAADLLAVLGNPDLQFTVFAPTNDAFAKVPKDQLDALLANKDMLKKVLMYHVAAGSLNAAAVSGAGNVSTLEGDMLTVTVGDDKSVKLDSALVTKADIAATNGTIHVIDTVLMPPAQ